MQTHMDTHRQLLMRKEDQVSQYAPAQPGFNASVHQQATNSVAHSAIMTSSQPAGVDIQDMGSVPEWHWDDEALEDDLFGFLLDPAPSLGMQAGGDSAEVKEEFGTIMPNDDPLSRSNAIVLPRR
jgi:hypothetical protein